MKEYLFPMSGLEASRAKTSLLRLWAREKDLEERGLGFFMSLLDLLEKHAPELLLSKTCRVSLVRTKEKTLKLFSERWPNSGILSGGVCLTAGTSECPSHASESTLSGVIETGPVRPESFLTPNAARRM